MTIAMPRRWAALLLVSLGLNLFLAGAIVGRWIRHPPHEGGPFALGPPGSEARAAVRRVWSARRDEMTRRFRAVQEARQRAGEALAGEPYDAARASAALADLRAATASVELGMHEGLLEVARDLPAAERADLVRAIGRRRGWMHPGWSGKGPKPGP